MSSGNAWQDKHFSHKPATPTPIAAASQGGDSYGGNFSGGNNGGRGNQNAIYQNESESLETKLDRIEAMMSTIDYEHGYRALADLVAMQKKLEEMVEKRNRFEKQLKEKLRLGK